MGSGKLSNLRILHLEKSCYSKSSLELLESVGEVDYREFSTQEELREHLVDHSYQVIITKLGFYLGSEELKDQDQLDYLLTPTTGLNHIDLDYADKAQIKVLSLKGESEFLARIQSTAEHTWTLLLSLIRNLIPAHKHVNQGGWDRIPHLAQELNTQTLGIIGLGRLGKILVKYAEAFSMRILCNDIDSSVFTEEYATYQSDLNPLLEESDYVILQIDYRPENENLFDKELFFKMKDGAFFINTSRGEMVDEAALVEALSSGKLAGAALDVLKGDSAWESESKDNDLLRYAREHDNLIITPHMGGYGRISIEMTRDFITKKFIKSI